MWFTIKNLILSILKQKDVPDQDQNILQIVAESMFCVY